MDRPPRTTSSAENVVPVKPDFAIAPDWPEAVSLREVLRRWKVSQQTVYRLARQGRLSGVQVGNRVVFPEDQLRRELGEPVVEPGGDGGRKGRDYTLLDSQAGAA